MYKRQYKYIAVHGFGSWSVVEAALTSSEAAGKDIKVQRTANRYDDDGQGKYVGWRLLLLDAVVKATRALPPQTNRCRITSKK